MVLSLMHQTLYMVGFSKYYIKSDLKKRIVYSFCTIIFDGEVSSMLLRKGMI